MTKPKQRCAVCKNADNGFPNRMSVVCNKCKHNPCLGKLYVPEDEPVILPVHGREEPAAVKYIFLAMLCIALVLVLMSVARFIGYL